MFAQNCDGSARSVLDKIESRVFGAVLGCSGPRCGLRHAAAAEAIVQIKQKWQ